MNKKEAFSKNLKYLRERYGETQADLTHFLEKKSVSSVSDWERGKSIPGAGVLSKIANRYNVSIDDLVEVDLRSGGYSKKPYDITQFQVVPIVGKVAAGEPNYAVEDIVGYMTLPPDQKSNNGLIYLEVSSDSMDKQFPIGSYVLVNTNVTIENGDIAVVKINGEEATLKQVKFDEEKKMIFLIPNSYNEKHNPAAFNANEDEVILVGKVIGMYQSI